MRYSFFLFVVFILAVIPLTAQDNESKNDDVDYYFRMKNDEFLHAMIPKEKYLLWIVRSVNDEIRKRQSEGQTASDLSLQDVVTPQEQIVENYVKELQQMIDLLDDIRSLERTAKQKVNLEVLNALVRLEKQVQEIVKRQTDIPELQRSLTDPVNLNKSAGASKGDGLNRTKSDDLSEHYGEDNLFEMWKYNRLLDYKTKTTEYTLLRTRLLHTASEQQHLRMFKKDLMKALESYSDGDYQFSRLLLQDILSTYTKLKVLDDVLYYLGESCYALNLLDDALGNYRQLISEYPNSSFIGKSLARLIFIYYIYEDYENLSATYERFVNAKNRDEYVSGTVSYLVGYSRFRAKHYNKALNALGRVPPQSNYFFPSLYLSAACYSNIGKENQSVSIYERLINEKNPKHRNPVLRQIRNNALLKLGLIYYDKGMHQLATSYFNQVSEDFQYYDLSILGKAWSAYRSGRPGETLRNTELLLQRSMVSSYAYEAKVLAASSKELLGHSEEAVADLKQVFDVGKQQPFGDETGSGNTFSVLQDAQNLQDERNRELISDVKHIRTFLEKSSADTEQPESDGDVSSDELSEKAKMLSERIAILDQLEQQARSGQNQSQIREIRELRADLIKTLGDQTGLKSMPSVANVSDPLLQRMGLNEYLKYTFQSLILKTVTEKKQTSQSLDEVSALIQDAWGENKIDLVIHMEIRKEELQDYYGKLNQYEVWLRENFPKELHVELDQWAAFSGYGISNINFSRIKETEKKMAVISGNIDALDRVFETKKKRLENRIQGLLSDVAKIENQMRQEAETRDENKKERFFETEYFNRQRQEPAVGTLKEKPESKN